MDVFAQEADRNRGNNRVRKLGCPLSQGLEAIQEGSSCIRKKGAEKEENM